MPSDEDNDAIKLFLKNLSDKYEDNGNADFSIDQGWNYLESQNKELYKEKVQSAIDNGENIPAYESILKKDKTIEVTGEELLNQTIDRPLPLIPDFLMLGSCTLLVGASKIGKSWMALQLAKSIVTGKWLFESKRFLPEKKRHVLYLANEDAPFIIQDRLKKLNVTPEEMKRLHLMFEWKTRGYEAVNRVKEYIKNKPVIKLVIIDCLGTVRGKANSRSVYQDDYVEIERWRDLCHELKISIIIIHHPRKTMSYGNVSDYDIMELVSGSNALGGAADRTMVLIRKRNDVKAKLYSMGRDCMDISLALLWEPVETGKGWILNGNGNIEETEETEERRQIMLFIADDIRTTGEIAYALNRKKPATSLLLEKMEDDGRIEKIGYGKWKRK